MYTPVLLVVGYNTPVSELQALQAASRKLGMECIYEDVAGLQIGYATAANRMIHSYSKGFDCVFVANPDISLSGLSKKTFLDGLAHFDVLGYSMNQHGTTYYGGTLDRWRMSGGLNTTAPEDRFYPCDFVSGSLIGIKKSVLNTIGLLDESYYMYYEDVDYCIRARQAGFRVGIDTSQTYDHFETSDTNAAKKHWLAKNRIKVLWKYGTFSQKLYEIARLPKTVLEEKTHLL